MNLTTIRRIRERQPVLTLIIDIICINLSLILALFIRFVIFVKVFSMSLMPDNITLQMHIIIHLTASLIWSLTFYFFELYDRKKFSASRALLGSFFGFWVLISLTYFNHQFAYSRLTGLLSWLFTSISVVGWRAIFSLFLKTETGKLIKRRNTIIVGRIPEIKQFFNDLKRFLDTSYYVVGFFIIDHHAEKSIEDIPVLGKLDELPLFLKNSDDIETIIFTVNAVSYNYILDLQNLCRNKNYTYRIMPETQDFISGNVNIMEIDDIPMIDLMLNSIHQWEQPVKRFIDIMVSAISLVILSPVIIITMIAVMITSRGPIFYKQERIGIGGKPFMLYKFRSMVENAEKESGPVWADKDDARLTIIGKFLRTSSIDEIPQLWNILKGDMSLVGPRPERLFFVNQHKELQDQRLRVKPGLTGLAQVNGRYHLTIEEKTRYDLYYIHHQSLLLDLDILLKTIWITFSQRGAQ